MWSVVVDGPKVFYPDKPKAADAVRPVNLKPAPVAVEVQPAAAPEPTSADLLRDIRRSRIRQRIWIGVATVQVGYLVAAAFWLH